MRPFCIATIGVILGIIMGLYLKSIALFIFLLILIILLTIMANILTRIQIKKHIKSICIFSICFSFFWGYTYFLENGYQKINQTYDKEEILFKAIVVSNKIEKEYKDVYQIQVTETKKVETIIENKDKNDNKTEEKETETVNKDKGNNETKEEEKSISSKYEIKKQKFKMILNVKKDKNTKLELQYGDEILFMATYEEPSTERNEGGFNYQQYLKTKKIVGIVTVKPGRIETIEKNKTSLGNKIIHNLKERAITKIKTALPTDTANLCISLLLGEKEELSENIQQDFRYSNLSHMLAISGAHVSYILLGISTIIRKLKLHKRWSKIFLIVFLTFFMALVGFTPSVTRACIMAILQLLASVLFKKSDTYQNLAISSFIILLVNPYALLDIGFQLSFGGTIGIVLFSKRLIKKRDTRNLNDNDISKKQMYIEKKENDKETEFKELGKQNKKIKDYKKNNKLLGINIVVQTIIKTIKEMCIVTISANILIIPIMMFHFNTISLTFLISNVLASPILGTSLILSMIFFTTLFICQPMAKLISFFLQPVLKLLICIASFSSKLSFSQILVPTPALWQILLYYLTLVLLFFVKPKRKSKNKKIVLIIIIFLIISPHILQIFPDNKLTIHFIDVGQGDSMLIQTPSHKTVLVDGGGSETGSFDIGEKTLLPYLLDKGILKIDYMLFSHFDSDHCQRINNCYGKIKS